MVQTSYPGVYIDEFEPAPPIQAAGTSVAAFIGAASMGDINVPTQITSFNQFVSTFGARPIYGFYLWYAVRGFFDNGGTSCFVIRASNGAYARNRLVNTNNLPVFTIRTTQPGVPTPPITVGATDPRRVTAADLKVFTIAPMTVTVSPTDSRSLMVTGTSTAWQLQPGDTIEVLDNRQQPTGQQANVVSTSFTPTSSTGAGTATSASATTGPSIRVDAALTIPSGGSVRLAPLPAESTTVALEYLPLTNATDPATSKRTLLVISDALVQGALLTFGLNPVESRIIDGVGVKVLSDPDPSSNATKTLFVVTLRDTLDGAVPRSDPASAVGVDIREFTLTVTPQGLAPRAYANLGVDLVHPRYAPVVVTGSDPAINLAQVDPPPPGQPDVLLPDPTQTRLLNDPAALTNPIKGLLESGANEVITDLPSQTAWLTDALNSLVTPIDSNSSVPIVNIVAIPDIAALASRTDALGVQQAVLAHCELLGDRFGVLDAFAPNQDPFQDQVLGAIALPSIETQRQGLVSARGYTGLYYPWIRVLPATRGPLVSVPPSGHVCGLFARVDYNRGVHKAPANEPVIGAVAITRDMTNTDQGILNLQGINVIRTFTAGGQPILYGARTTTTDTNWQYVNVRRLFLFLETSISNSLRNSVFEPNNTSLWGGLNRTISAFLLEQWHNGALFGDKAEQAFYVKIDETNNPFTDRQLGKLTIEVGVQPTYPAEFIILRIGIWDGGSSVSES